MDVDEERQDHARFVSEWRRRVAILGLLALVALASFGTIGASGVLADVAFFGLAAATVLAWVEVRSGRRGRARVLPTPDAGFPPATSPRNAVPRARWERRIAPAVAALVAIGAVQTWFTPGTAVAGGDLAPPNGMAWLGQMFASWTWSGSDLGRPGSLETLLPWGALVWLVHGAGGSFALAQEVWLSLLYGSVALGAYALLRALRLSPLVALCGSLIYLFSPYLLSIGVAANFLMCMALLPIEASIILIVASGRWRIRTGVLCFLATTPLIGYVYTNPPLVLAVGFSILAAGLLGAALYGRSGGRRALATLGTGIPLVALASLYWAVPSFEQLQVTAVHQLSTLASWTWSEGRATLANAFWLNTSWAWRYAYYVPYAHLYARFPLSLLKYGLSILGFSALALPYEYRADLRNNRLLVVAAASTVSLTFVFLSTGTNLPGSLVFDPLYNLPYGWLLQGPNRFLMLAALGYAVLGSVTIAAAGAALRGRELSSQKGTAQVAVGLSAAIAIFAVTVVGPGYPLAFGAVVSGPRSHHMPSSHVRMPSYWTAMASYLNAKSTSPGNLLVLPPDDFYQMPYTWYYGNDGFITDMIARHVLDPSGQGYGPAPGQLLAAVNLVASSLLAGNFEEANLVLRALGTPDVLVRGDVISTFPGRHIDSPRALAGALGRDPAMRLVHRSGPLDLFRVRNPVGMLDSLNARVRYATVNSASPDLRDLAMFKRPAVLVSHSPIPGAPAVYQLPALTKWSEVGARLYATVHLTPGDTYSAALPSSAIPRAGPISGASIRPGAGPTMLGAFGVRMVGSTRGPVAVADLPLGSELLRDGSFRGRAAWGKVGDCNDMLGAASRPYLHANVVPKAGPADQPAMKLSASEDRACVAQGLSWHGGPILLQMSVRDLAGGPPMICVWESGPNTCAALPALPVSRRWRTYRAIVDPPAGTQALGLFLYATPPAQGVETIDEYAQVSARVSSAITRPVIVARPRAPVPHTMPLLTTQEASYTSVWHGGPGAGHVLVNGIMNGWLAPPRTRVVPVNSLTSIVDAAFGGSVLAALVGLALMGSLGVSVALERKRRRSTAPRRGNE